LLEIREKVPEGQAPSPSLAAFNKSFGTSHRGELLSVGFEKASIGNGASKILTLWKSPTLVDEIGGVSEQDFSDFWLEVSLRFSMGCFDLSSFFVRGRVPVLRIQVPRGSRRRSPLARSPMSSTLLTLATLQKIIVANQDTLLNFHSRNCTSQCNCY
jgi:hypothetical protein